jgi:hypothetical protein
MLAPARDRRAPELISAILFSVFVAISLHSKYVLQQDNGGKFWQLSKPKGFPGELFTAFSFQLFRFDPEPEPIRCPRGYSKNGFRFRGLHGAFLRMSALFFSQK